MPLAPAFFSHQTDNGYEEGVQLYIEPANDNGARSYSVRVAANTMKYYTEDNLPPEIKVPLVMLSAIQPSKQWDPRCLDGKAWRYHHYYCVELDMNEWRRIVWGDG